MNVVARRPVGPTKQSMARCKDCYVYMLTNIGNRVIYTGVTSDLARRLYEHESGFGSEFTKRYRANKLVYYEKHSTPYEAISREKQIKAGSRARKEALINSWNPGWKDLAPQI